MNVLKLIFPSQAFPLSFIFQLLLRTTLGTKINVKRADGIRCSSKVFQYFILSLILHFVQAVSSSFLSILTPQQFQLYLFKCMSIVTNVIECAQQNAFKVNDWYKKNIYLPSIPGVVVQEQKIKKSQYFNLPLLFAE